VLVAGFAMACGPRVGSDAGSHGSVGSATEGETDAASECPNDSAARTGFCFARAEIPFERPKALAGDFLGDGLTDLVLSSSDMTVFQWMDGSMRPVVSTDRGLGQGFTVRAGADDRDEMLSFSDSLLVRHRVVDGSIQSAREAWPGPPVGAVAPLVAIDTNLDGAHEIVGLDYPRRRELELDYTPVVVLAPGPEGWTIERDLPLRPHFMEKGGTAADLTGDGQLELVIAEQGSHPLVDPYDPARDSVVVFRATPQGLVEIGRTPLGIQHGRITTGDVDGDGLLDILVRRWIFSCAPPLCDPDMVASEEDEPSVAVLRNLGAGVFEDPVLLEDTRVTGFVAMDLDGDGRDELIFPISTGTEPTEALLVALVDPLGASNVVTLSDGRFSSLMVADFNNDGVDDVGFTTIPSDSFHLLMPIH
jgi:hypothetical protein